MKKTFKWKLCFKCAIQLLPTAQSKATRTLGEFCYEGCEMRSKRDGEQDLDGGDSASSKRGLIHFMLYTCQ
ncbi:MAG: hypothetical protein JWN70_7042 [Planctomycetaceae bacterium]|nr:hypothetical protein [Planctomycetaceae bacterium]